MNWMQRAFQLAKKGHGKVAPNPMVGAVIVKNGKILGEAFYEKFGGMHAERLAIQRARAKKHNLSGATLFVTLEPCVDFPEKKTPACAPFIAQSGIKHIIVARTDTNPKVSGRGMTLLKKAGIKTEFWKPDFRPFTAMKVAMSLDGKIATKTGDSKWITNEISRKWVKNLRDSFDAILVGKNTVLRDNPGLAGATRQPLRIILDSLLQIPQKTRALRDNNVLLVTTSRAPSSQIKYFQIRGIPIKIFPKKISIPSLLHALPAYGIRRLLVEGGAEVFGSFIDAKCVDKFYWFIAPKIIGGTAAATPAIKSKDISKIKNAPRITIERIRRFGNDILIEGHSTFSS